MRCGKWGYEIMKLKLSFILSVLMILIIVPVYAEFLNGSVEIKEGVYVYTNSEWESEILGINKLRNLNEFSSKILNTETIKYDFNSVNSEEKIKMLYGQMLQKAQSEKLALDTLKEKFLKDTDDIINIETENISLKNTRDELLEKDVFEYEGVTYLLKKQRSFIFIDNIQKTSSLLKNGIYYINNIDQVSPNTYYIFRIINSKSVLDCYDKEYNMTFNSDGFAVDDTGNPIFYAEISSSIINSYNVINNSDEYINQQLDNNVKADEKGKSYNSGAEWDFDNEQNKKVVRDDEPGNNLSSTDNANIKYDINTITVIPSTKPGRGKESIYYNDRNVDCNYANVKYTNLLEDPFNLCGGIYETDKEKSTDHRYNSKVEQKEHIVFERVEKKAPTEVKIKTDSGSYLLLNLKLNKSTYINSQLEVYKDGEYVQDITMNDIEKDVLIDVSDCSEIKFTVKPIAKQIDINKNTMADAIVFEPGRYVKQGVYSKNFIEENPDVTNFYEYNDMRLYADIYLIF